MKRRASKLTQKRLLKYYLVGKQESGCAVVELHQIHMPIEIVQLAQNARSFVEMEVPLTVAHRSQQLTEPARPRLRLPVFHVDLPASPVAPITGVSFFGRLPV